MCLLAFRWMNHPTYALVLAGNRDEAYARPTASADFWDDAPEVLAGRDLKAGGTWMGVSTTGRWSVITNIRNPDAVREDAPSRGHLVSEYLQSRANPVEHLESLAPDAHRYNGFNLIAGDLHTCAYLSNGRNGVEEVEPGIHGLSNAVLDDDWPKTQKATAALRRLSQTDAVAPEALTAMLVDRDPFPAERLPDTGVGVEVERMLSPLFIESESYGTRASTVLLITHTGRVTFVERTFHRGEPGHTRRYQFEISSSPSAESPSAESPSAESPSAESPSSEPTSLSRS